MLSDEQRKALTLYLGEKWLVSTWRNVHCDTCKCGELNRTFTAPADLHAVYSRMVELGEWSKWDVYSLHLWDEQTPHTAWLFCLSCPDQIPERLKIVAEFLGKED